MTHENLILGTGTYLKEIHTHPYIGQVSVCTAEESNAAVIELNKGRDNSRGPNIEVDYYFEVKTQGKPLEGIKNAAKMVLEHVTLKQHT